MDLDYSWIDLLIGLSGVVLGPILLYCATRDQRLAIASLKWPSVRGRVMTSWVDKSTSYDYVSFTPEVYYSYSVNDRPFYSLKIAYSDLPVTEWGSQQLVSRYPERENVTVYYDPSHPENAVLEPGGLSLRGFIVGILALGGGIALLYHFFR